MALCLCVDSGGSKTSAVICDSSGKVLGHCLSGPSNLSNIGVDIFLSTIHHVISDALKECNRSTSNAREGVEVPVGPLCLTKVFAAAWFGVSGVNSPASVASITPVLSTLLGIPPGPRLLITNDAHLLATPLHFHSNISHAIACIAGTGSISVSFTLVSSEIVEIGRVGGWGWILGDEGGGFHVGREAVRRLLTENDVESLTGETTPKLSGTLKARVLEKFAVTDVLELLTVVHLPDPSPLTLDSSGSVDTLMPPHLIPREKRLSSLSPIVFACAFEDGDPLALDILRTCAGHLASQIAVLLHPRDQNSIGETTDTGISDARSRTIKASDSILCFGGSLVGVEAYRKMVLEDLAERGHVFRCVEFVDDAATRGASSLARSFSIAGI
jgi:N-acetylglucosamine kinase-like BadF-type ATPase